MEQNSETRKFGAGRPKGSPNKITAEIKHLLASWAETELRNISELYSLLSPKEKSKFICNILPYIIPKQKEIDISIDSIPQHQVEDIIERLLDGQY